MLCWWILDMGIYMYLIGGKTGAGAMCRYGSWVGVFVLAFFCFFLWDADVGTGLARKEGGCCGA
ncbi:hypothetical protein BDW02DRAFT_177279 [Decorospora gaudefroyi]|uniref:Uncharacterized protein n=1 Tax=Decorospora gaudefroyi TaxID=184978 RepID=A0A6A5JY36_9PLEO|nr:hypothetical protein BDW02DRAFT_177279 [Decorospora gaudefroyi]